MHIDDTWTKNLTDHDQVNVYKICLLNKDMKNDYVDIRHPVLPWRYAKYESGEGGWHEVAKHKPLCLTQFIFVK